jgi:ACS family D-galactonate transporter-like MFS transporter
VATAVVGFANSLGGIIGCRIGVGAFEAPAFPTNIRCITAWHPSRERALAAGYYNAAQFVALGFLTPVLAWVVVRFGWKSVFYVTGAVGLIVSWVWHRWYRDPKDSTSANQEELQYIAAGGGLAANTNTAAGAKASFSWSAVGQLLSYRQVWGLIIGQGTLATALFFFLTWFPSYLVKAKGLGILRTGFYAMIPFLVGIVGAILGGKLSDWMLTKGYSNSAARKIPICVGFALAIAIVGANYTSSIPAVIAFMTVAFFGTSAASAVTHAICSDMAPQGRVGMLTGLQFLCGNIGGLLSPLVVGFIVNSTGGFNLALVYVSVTQIVGLICYIFVMGRVNRIELNEKAIG